jgi:hypothetical protein
MAKYVAHLRYYPGDPLEEIRQVDLDEIGRPFGVDISFQRIDNRAPSAGMLREETLDKPLEEITQDVITVAGDDEGGFRKTIVAVYDRYRSPRATYSFWGSSPEGERIAKELAEETGGGW